MVSVLVSTAVARGFEPLSDQTKGYKIGMCCDNHTSLWSKNKDGLFGNRIICPSGRHVYSRTVVSVS